MAYKKASRHQQYVAQYGFKKSVPKISSNNKKKIEIIHDIDGFYRDTTIREINAGKGRKCIYFKCLSCGLKFSVRFEKIIHAAESNTTICDVLEKAKCIHCESIQLIAYILLRGKRIILSHNID